MPEESEEGALVVRNTEIEPSEPVGLKYFKAVDAMVQGVPIKDGKYFDILVHKKGLDQPTVKILRVESKYIDKNIGKQDEIALANKETRLQFNAECTEDGEYIDYPKNPSLAGMTYLAETVQTFSDAASVDGSTIRINNAIRLVSVNGVWVPYEDDRSKRPPQLGKPQEQLPGKERKALPDSGDQSAKATAILLNAMLGLKKKKLA